MSKLKTTVAGIAAMFVMHSAIAQDTNFKAENLVNDQFGTLLETLITDGKITEANAKSYLEAVFGYDETVTNYLQSANLSQATNFSQGNLSLDNFMSQLNNGLISATLQSLPPEKQKEYQDAVRGHSITMAAGNEWKSGQIGANTIAFGAEFLSGISESIQAAQDAKEEKARLAERNKRITEKIEKITPTLEKLATQPYKKLKITDEVDSEKNWNTKLQFREKKWTTQTLQPGNQYVAPFYITTYHTTRYSSNPAVLQNGHLKLNTENFISKNKDGSAFWDGEKN